MESNEWLCPITGIIDLVGKKWCICIIILLGNGNPIRFNELKRELGGISPKTLSDRLKDLERKNLVERNAYAEVPLRVEYSLTEEGKTLFDALMPLVVWVREHEFADVSRCALEDSHENIFL